MGNTLLYPAPEPSYHPLEYSVDLGQSYIFLRHLRSMLGVHVMAMEYPGYGICSGVPSEPALLEGADAVLGYVDEQLAVPLDRVLLMGQSLGGGPAIYLASKHSCAGLITLATFASIPDVAGSYFGLVGWLVDVFDNASRIRAVSCQTLIIHGREDGLIGVDQAERLAAECGQGVDGGGPRAVLEIRDGVDHNSFDTRRDIIKVVQNTFPELLKGRPLPTTAMDAELQQQPERLAQDVLTRVPYSPGWEPRNPAFAKIRIVNPEGFEV